MTALLVGHGLTKRYGAQCALAEVDVSITAGEVVGIMGPSGSGKTTLLHVLAGLVRPDDGAVLLDGRRVDALTERRRSTLRRTAFGFVFQDGMLVDELSAQENVALPLLLGGTGRREALAAARDRLAALGLAGLHERRPGELSGGQAQRVAIARALAHRPSVIFADEPTGALDRRTGMQTVDALFEAAASSGAAVVMVTHDQEIADRIPRVLRLTDGRIDGAVTRAGVSA